MRLDRHRRKLPAREFFQAVGEIPALEVERIQSIVADFYPIACVPISIQKPASTRSKELTDDGLRNGFYRAQQEERGNTENRQAAAKGEVDSRTRDRFHDLFNCSSPPGNGNL